MRQVIQFSNICTLIFLQFLGTSSATADIIFSETFEYTAADLTANAIGFTASNATVPNPTGVFHDGGADYFSIMNVPGSPLSGAPHTSVPFSGFTGQFFAAEDIDDGNTRPATQTLGFNVNVTGFTDLNLDILFAAGGNDGTPGYDSNDGFLVRAQVDGGGFQNLLAFEAIGTTNQELRQDADFNGSGDLAGFLPSPTATAFSGLTIVGAGANLLLEVVVSSNDGNGEFAFDSLVVNGTTAVPEPSSFAFLGLVCVGFVGWKKMKGRTKE